MTGNTQVACTSSANESGQLADTPAVNMYPNPIAEGGTLSIKADRNMTLRVYTVLVSHSAHPFVPNPNRDLSDGSESWRVYCPLCSRIENAIHPFVIR